MKIGVILGSIREGRFGESVARWVVDRATKRADGTDYVLIDVKEFDVPLLTTEELPMMANKKYADQRVQRFSDAVDACDAFVFVTAEYNHGIPGAFKNAYDSLGSEWANKPVAFVTYSSGNGIRVVEQWRQVVANFSQFDIRETVEISRFADVAEDGSFAPTEGEEGALTGLLDSLNAAAQRFA